MVKTFTLGYNTPQSLHDRFLQMGEYAKGHTLFDLGFPLIDEATNNIYNLGATLNISNCNKYGVEYYKIPNKGVSQNWTSAFTELRVGMKDVLVGVEPDEVTDDYSWIPKMGQIIEADPKMAVVSLNTSGHQTMIDKGQLSHTVETIAGHKVYIINGLSNWAMIGVNGAFLHRFEGMPVPSGHSIYGHIESACYPLMQLGRYRWCILADHYCMHIETSKLYRQYKTDVTSGDYVGKNQIPFDKWLNR
jgi:hypothetical protein